MTTTTVSFNSLLSAVQDADEDFEWYPTTSRMIDVVSRWLDKTATSLMDIGAGDGRVLTSLLTRFENPSLFSLYAIEKSAILVQAQPENVIPVGTDLFEQNLACLPVDYIFSNPPYSQYETWASLIIESGHAQKAFLILPQRWKENDGIKLSLKKRGATARVLHSDNFYDAPRQARAVIDIIEVTYPKKNDGWGREVKDPFDIWFDENISTFDQEKDESRKTDHELRQEAIARIRQLDTITDLVEAYREEYERMEANYRAIFQLDYALLKELGVSKENVRDGIKLKMAGLKSKYWTALFERLSAITNRLSTATKAKFTERLTGRVALAFTSSNAYAVVLWAIKNANKYFDEQTLTLYRDLSTFDGVSNYKSNVKTWAKDKWRYCRSDIDGEDSRPSHYALDYRIVVERWRAIGYGYDYPGNLSKWAHEMIADVVAVLYNLGFPSDGQRSLDRQWTSGGWQNWYRIGTLCEDILFQVKAFKNGNLHFRFAPQAMKALNVEAGRLLGWLRSPEDVVKELGYTKEEAEFFYSCMKLITPGSVQYLLGAGDTGDAGNSVNGGVS